jgi:hypothetical protein
MAMKWHDKAVESAANSKFGTIDEQLLYDIYLEASGLMGIEPREFSHNASLTGRAYPTVAMLQ